MENLTAKGLTIDNLFYRTNKQTKERILIQLTPSCIMDIKSNGANSSFIYEPIPLTEQVLVDCGFEKSNKYSFKNQKLIIEQMMSIRHACRFRVTPEESIWICEKHYLHQLQNLYFALTGQELEYKPKK